MRPTRARKKVYRYLGEALPPLFARFREEWEEGGTLPTGVTMGRLTYDHVASPVREEKAYLTPQEVKTIDDRLPVISVTSAIAQPWIPTEHADGMSEEFRGSHQIQVYCWTATEEWMDVVDAIEALAGCIAYAVALDQSLGDATDGIQIKPDTISISYSEPAPHGGSGAIAGAAVAFMVSTEDTVTLTATGTVETAAVTVHPALEG